MPICLRTVAVIVLILGSTMPAQANWFRNRSATPTTTAAYYPAPYLSFPVFPSAGPIAVAPVPYYPPEGMPSAAPRLYAVPTPAPAPPAPAAPPASGVRESQSNYPALGMGVSAGTTSPSQRCSVGFWNQSGRDLVLRVDGQLRRLPRGQGVTLQLPRGFVWQVDEREPVKENVPENQPTMDLVIRR